MPKKNLYIIYFVIISILGYLQAQTVVACVGNSITLGIKSTSPYPDQLGALLSTNYIVNNCGHASTTILKNGEDPYWLTTEYGWAIGFPYDFVVISFGTNATRPVNWDYHSAEFEDDYMALIAKIKQWDNTDHNTEFFLGLPPPIYGDGSIWGVSDDVLKNEVIPKIRIIANQTGATIVDFYNPMSNHPEWFDSDGIHPNATGDSVIAKIVYDAIHKSQSTYDPPPVAPKGLKTISGSNYIKLVWNTNEETDINSYHVYRSENIGDTKTYKISVSGYDTTWTDFGVQNNPIYYYHIVASDLAGNRSDPSNTVIGSVLDQTPPSAPLNLHVILEADSVKTGWTPNIEPDIDKYHIYRNTVLNDIQQSSSIIGTIHAPDSNFFDINYVSATNYYYGIKAVDISGNQGLISNIVSVTTTSRPLSSDTTLTFYEDRPHQFLATNFPFSDADNHTLDKIIFIDSNYLDYFTYDNDTIDRPFICEDISKLVFSPKLNEFGNDYADFSFEVIDSFGSTSIDTNMVIINLVAVNDSPYVDPISDLYLMEDSHNLLLPITGIRAGPANELQNLTVEAFADFVNVSDIRYNSPEDTGLVIIDPVENAFGIIPVTIQIEDDGGTINGGINTFSTIFNIHIAPVNDPPILNVQEIEISEDLVTTVELTGIQPGPWETDQQINISVQSNNTDILPHPTLVYNTPDTTATLTFSTIPNIFGTTSITIYMSDDGGTDFGGEDSISYNIPVEIISINDKPDDFHMATPASDSTLVINKSNYLNTFLISWEASSDIENDDILYNIVFSTNFSTLSRYGINSTNTEYILKEFLSVTDTVSIATGTFSVIATDGDLQTEAINGGIAITVDGRSFAPAKLQLDQNYPNPFNHATVIGFDLPKRGNISIIIYDLLGEEIIKLINNKNHERGYNTVTWNGLDKNNNLITAGIYIVQLRMGSNKKHKKLIFLK